MKREIVLKEIYDLLAEYYESATDKILTDERDLIMGTPDWADTILYRIEQYMEPKTGGKHQTSYELAMGSRCEWDK